MIGAIVYPILCAYNEVNFVEGNEKQYTNNSSIITLSFVQIFSLNLCQHCNFVVACFDEYLFSRSVASCFVFLFFFCFLQF